MSTLDATPMTCPTPVNPDGMNPPKSVSATVSPLAVRTSFCWSAPEPCSARKSAGGGPGFGRSWPFGTGSSCKYAPAPSLGGGASPAAAAGGGAAASAAPSLCYEPDSSTTSPTCQALLLILDDIPAPPTAQGPAPPWWNGCGSSRSRSRSTKAARVPARTLDYPHTNRGADR